MMVEERHNIYQSLESEKRERFITLGRIILLIV